MWKIVYNLATGICTAVNSRDPETEEGVIYLNPALCAWVNVSPNRYKVVDGALAERPEWAEEEAAKAAAAETQAKKDAIAAERFRRETAGVEYDGMVFKTDRESQQILDSTIEKIRRGLVPGIRWKCENGWYALSLANIDAIEITVLTHVQGSFAWEEAELIAQGLV